jgi:UDP:flavonoid glycosyltransferase YjiC (YdhE family)
MAKILYGVSGEGSGHSTRALVVAQHLLEQGHEVRLASYDRGYRNLAPKFDVLENEGLTIGS